ncbi:MAG: hypothetical protein U1F51_15675 [Burkholderiales bacterium]
MTPLRSPLVAACAALLMPLCAIPVAQAAKTTSCAKVGLCYCMNDDHRGAIDAKVERFRQTLASERAAGKTIVYLSVPLTSAGGGNFDVNKEVAESIRQSIERRWGAGYVYVLNPGTPEAELPRGAGGAEYMVMWTAVLEGADGMGDFDAVYFAGPQDFARHFGFDGNNDMAKLDAYFDRRVATNPAFAKAVDAGLTKAAFRRYYAWRASAGVSRGAHDEWNIFRVLNEKRRADAKVGTPGQIAIVYDGQTVAPPQVETPVTDGYVGRCAS